MDPFMELDNDTSSTSVQDILAELLGGARRPKYVYIYTHARLNVAASKDAGHRVYDEAPYIIIKFDSRDDAVSRPVTDQDKKRFAKEWKRYQATLSASADPSIEVLPAASVATRRELSDMGITRISALLARAEELDERFQPVVKQALVWQQLNDETENEDGSNG